MPPTFTAGRGWIIDLVNYQLEGCRQPLPAGIYTDFKIYLPDESITPLSALGKTVAVADLLPLEPKQNL